MKATRRPTPHVTLRSVTINHNSVTCLIHFFTYDRCIVRKRELGSFKGRKRNPGSDTWLLEFRTSYSCRPNISGAVNLFVKLSHCL
ncbi:hypothetical protein C8Q73DRAFT_170152 [Cubamyces lactineus]|nr:hypothetical protein C8Q73DRAFT_170152 [Cubamyces lactineus]